MDRTAYESHLKNLHSWAGHLESTIETAIPQTIVELGPAGEESLLDVKNAAETLRDVARSLDDVMNAYDSLLESAGRPRRYDDFLQRIEVGSDTKEVTDVTDEDLEAGTPEINRARFARLSGELQFDAGWLLGAIHGALISHSEDTIDEHLDSLATGIEELMISYDRLQDLIGILPARHCAFVDHMVVLEEAGRRHPRDRRGRP
ncbi:hypothetical protein [Singulisphaera acidiphila]|uniref:Uncharacterized protein n=1 Tax=Singulisphaera acidiphila (strain ATCC BAA-1392 / DSM 18658 / VKM B-2454 / MOB10) TaxID=886293 RepID=L0DJT9_SINAD|nr:hypothetical protein [Singulisphaera acidiphila]AGA29103.1 hypothetical protein Sinac_4947 [Singulisphaera acidiphila DSM 18658]